MEAAMVDAMRGFAELAKAFDREAESKMPISRIQIGLDLRAMRERKGWKSETVAVMFNERFAEYGITLSGSALRYYERGENEIPYRTLELLLSIYKPPGMRNALWEAYRPDVAKTLGVKEPS